MPQNPNIRLTNYHSHTTRCMHATGTEEEYVLQAIASGFECLGFADHTAWPYRSDFVANMRMHISQLEDYIFTVRGLREKYAEQIRIFVALECEAFPEYYPWLREIREKYALDYLILGNHYDTTDEWGGPYFGRCKTHECMERYVETTIAGMESGLFAYLAHPDIFLHRYPVFDACAERSCRRICEAAKRLDMPIEYNLLGHRRNPEAKAQGFVGYCSPEFWEIAEECGNRCIIGVDAHAPEHLDCADLFREVYRNLERRGLEVISAPAGVTDIAR